MRLTTCSNVYFRSFLAVFNHFCCNYLRFLATQFFVYRNALGSLQGLDFLNKANKCQPLADNHLSDPYFDRFLDMGVALHFRSTVSFVLLRMKVMQ